MSTYLVFGGSSGLGLDIVNNLSQKGREVISISRRKLNSEVNHLRLDLSSANDSDIQRIFTRFPVISGICFSQRFRSSESTFDTTNSRLEFSVMVESIARILSIFESTIDTNRDSDEFTRIVIIGSTYASSVGYDQNWCYHACKAAQIGLVKYYSQNRKCRYNINMLSPATFVKDGAEEYWSEQEKSKIWSNYPNQRLATSKIVAEEAVNLLLNSSIYNSGNNIICDGGVCHLYHDQQIN